MQALSPSLLLWSVPIALKNKIIHNCYVKQLSIKLYRAIQLITHRIDNQLSQSAMLFLRAYRNVEFCVCDHWACVHYAGIILSVNNRDTLCEWLITDVRETTNVAQLSSSYHSSQYINLTNLELFLQMLISYGSLRVMCRTRTHEW